jgi:hypothetical protein
MTGKEGYFLAKRQIQELFDGRLEVLDEKIEKLRKDENVMGIAILINEKLIVEKMRSFFRNGLLWNTENEE